MKFCFVILNYNTYDYTISCITSIKERINDSDVKIIVVDNLSPDKSGDKLKSYYKDEQNIEVILNSENAGFAKGNNVGIKYALKKYNPDFIVVNNSDTLLINNNTFEIIEEAYKKYDFAILGPKIYIRNNQLQYIPTKLPAIDKVKKVIKKYYIRYFLNLIYLEKLESKIFNKRSIISENNTDADKIYENVVVHGSFFVLSKNYLKYYSGIPENTTYYREEDFLYINCQQKNLKILYYPKLKIKHDVNGSVKSSFKNQRKQNLFKFKRHIIANKILYRYMKDNNL